MKVLIIDDSSLLQSRLKEVLMEVDANMDIAQAYNCREAMESFSSFGPELIILDISLPDGSGIDLLRNFKKVDPSVKVIIFTNYPTAEFKKSCLDLSASHFIEKSSFSSLISAIG